jgi:MtN3 and saliva related transmembrane protein
MQDWLSNPLYIGTAAGILTSVSMIPQLIKLIRDKNSENISVGTLIILVIGLGCWVWYGILKNDIPLIVTNGFSVLVNGANIFFGILYKRKKS